VKTVDFEINSLNMVEAAGVELDMHRRTGRISEFDSKSRRLNAKSAQKTT
jgi:hypothetical protein